MSIEDKLQKLGITLTGAPAPVGSYIPCVQSGSLLFLSGALPLRDGKLYKTGRVGECVSINEAGEAARQVVINAISILKSYLGDLNKIKRCVKICGFVASASDFHDQHKVLNYASELIFEIFGDAGRHARSSVGVYKLPLDAPVEIDFIFEVKE